MPRYSSTSTAHPAVAGVATAASDAAEGIHASRGCYREGWSPFAFRRLAMNDTIIAIDLGRHKSVACVYHRGTRAHAFRTESRSASKANPSEPLVWLPGQADGSLASGATPTHNA